MIMPSIIRPRLVGRILSHFILALAALMLVPLGYALATRGGDTASLALAALVTGLCGGVMRAVSGAPVDRELKVREGILLTALVWLSLCFFGCLPYWFSPYFAGLTDAFFESASGFTTTGATVLGEVEALSDPIQLWRCYSQWLGGMGIVLLGVAVLPLIGQGGAHLYRAEFSGAKSQRLAVRTREAARALWRIYLVLTLAETLALWLAGMRPFDALCHSFTTLATGGFSTRSASIAAFDSEVIDYIVTFFMVCSGVSFIQYYRLVVERDHKRVTADYEWRAYLLILLAATAVLTGVLLLAHEFKPEAALRAALFQVTSILTTTGFATEDYSTWYPLAQILLLCLMFVGGCTGSTAGGLKVARAVMLGRVIQREFKRMAEPHGVFPVLVNNESIPEHAIQGLLNLVYLAWLTMLGGAVVLAATGVDLLTAFSATVACLFNIGPGLNAVGPVNHYGDLSGLAKWTLSFCMIAGRLEIYTLLLIFTPVFWRR
jgi:trk system potassium uptake protein